MWIIIFISFDDLIEYEIPSSSARASVAQLVRASSHKPGRGFDFQSGHMPGLRVWSPVQAHRRGNRLMFLFHTDVSLPLSFSPFPSL